MNDLDARVAALMSKIVNHRYVPIELVDANRADLEHAIRAELQKPALHELVTDEETDKALRMFNVVGGDNRTRIRRTLSHFLQGRAQPAQEEITDAERYRWIRELPNADSLNVRFCGSDLDNVVDAAIRASKGEKT